MKIRSLDNPSVHLSVISDDQGDIYLTIQDTEKDPFGQTVRIGGPASGHQLPNKLHRILYDLASEFKRFEKIRFESAAAQMEDLEERQAPVEGLEALPKDLLKESQRFLKTLSESPYNNTPVTNAQVVVRELVNFLDRPASYDPDHVSGETCTLEGWIARDCFRGNICLFEHKPVRPSEQDLGIWKCHCSVLTLPKEAFPKLRWEDDPVEVKVTITPKQ